MHSMSSIFFFFNDTATTEIYTLSLHDALPISGDCDECGYSAAGVRAGRRFQSAARGTVSGAVLGVRGETGDRAEQSGRSEEHTSELQSLAYLVCRLLLEKKKQQTERGGYTLIN